MTSIVNMRRRRTQPQIVYMRIHKITININWTEI